MSDCFCALLDKQLQNFHCCCSILLAEIMKRHPTPIVYSTNRGGRCVDEKLNNIESDVFVIASVCSGAEYIHYRQRQENIREDIELSPQ
jgi:hypothetical protein